MRKVLILLCCGLAVAISIGLYHFIGSEDGDSTRTKYCRLRFGSQNQDDLILGRSSEDLLVFRSGEINSTPERYWLDCGCLPDGVQIPPFKFPDGSSYTITSVTEYTLEQPVARTALLIDVKAVGNRTLLQYCDVELVELNDNTSDLNLAHFDASATIVPLKVNGNLPPALRFVIGGEPTDVRAQVGTMDAACGCWVVMESDDRNFPSGRVHPTVTIEFPTEQGLKPIVKTYKLDQFC